MKNINEQKRLAGIGPRFEWTTSEQDDDRELDDEPADGPGVGGDREMDEASTPREAQAAFDREVVPRLLMPAMDQAKKAIMKIMVDLDNGKWPDKKVEYAVMRYKPGSMTDEDFIEGLLRAYSDWSQGTFK